MTYVNLTADGAILGQSHTTQEAAVAAAKQAAKRVGGEVRVVCYGNAGEVLSSKYVTAS
jgi:hypothetical protein